MVERFENLRDFFLVGQKNDRCRSAVSNNAIEIISDSRVRNLLATDVEEHCTCGAALALMLPLLERAECGDRHFDAVVCQSMCEAFAIQRTVVYDDQ